MKEISVEIVKDELLMFLATMNIFMADTPDEHRDKDIEEENKNFLKNKFLEITSGNINPDILDKAIDEIYPFLRQK